MRSTSPTISSKKRDFTARATGALLALAALLLIAVGCAEKKAEPPLTETEKAGFKQRSARH